MHNDYSLAPGKLKISHYIANKYDIKTGVVNKLIPNLGNKSKYVLHYKNIQLYLLLGIKLTFVCLDYNTDKRKNAVNSFEKDCFKLTNNSVDGKTMEHLSKS